MSDERLEDTLEGTQIEDENEEKSLESSEGPIPNDSPIIQEEELFDDEFIVQQITDEKPDLSKEVYTDGFKKDDLFLIVFQEDDSLKDIMATIEDILIEEKKIRIKDEEENDYFLEYNEENYIVLSTDEYNIIEIDKVEEFDLDKLDTINFILTKEIYPEIEINVEEVAKKDYSEQEKKEDMINELIISYNAYGNKALIGKISSIVTTLLSLIRSRKKYEDFTDVFQFIKEKSLNGKKMKWIIPIIDNRKVLFRGEEESNVAQEDIDIVDFEKYLDDLYKLQESESGNHNEILQSIYSDNTFVSGSGDGLSVDYYGNYFRSCNDNSPCNGLVGQYYYDENKTYDKVDRFGERLINYQKISLKGFYILPSIYGSRLFNGDLFSLSENAFLSEYKHSYKLFRNMINYSKMIPHIIDKGSVKTEFTDNKLIHSYFFTDDSITYLKNIKNKKEYIDELYLILRNNLPDYNDIIDSYDKEILKEIFNYNDFNRLFSYYGIVYNDMGKGTRSKINDLIKINIINYIKNYNRSVKRKKIKRIKKQTKLLDTDEKIQKSRDYIFSIVNVPVKNDYLKKFIDIFSRNPSLEEDQNFLYEKHSKEKFLCKHYNYDMKASGSEELYLSMKNIFGMPPKDGSIYCSVCGEYICPDDFSTFEGFSDGAPTKSNEVLANKVPEEILNQKQLENKKRLDKLSSLFSITLTHIDSKFIMEMYDTITEEELINKRYNSVNAYKKHPKYSTIKGKYEFTKPARTKEEKQQNKKNNDLMKNELEKFKQESILNNHMISDLFLILLVVQTADPSYNISKSLNLFSEFNMNDANQELYKYISAEAIDNILKFLYRMVETNTESIYWKNINLFLIESNIFTSLPSFKEQFFNIARYFFRNKNIADKCEKYLIKKKNPFHTSFIKDSWPTYKPLKENPLIKGIDQIVDDIDKENLKTYDYENHSLLQSLEEAVVKPKYEVLEIPFSEIIMNQSYQRLYDYSVHLHGRSGQIPMIDLLINRFIDTIEDKESMKSKMIDLGWDPLNKSVKKIDYQTFKEIIIVDITGYFKGKNPDDINTLNTYIHIHFNNFNGMLLNGHAKRIYQYTEPIIYPIEGFTDLMERKKKMIDTLFNSYCLDKDGDIQKTYLEDSFILNLLAGPDLERAAYCYGKISKTPENFHKILEYKNDKNRLPFIEHTEKELIIENRLYDFIRNSNLLNHDADESYSIFRNITELIQEKESLDSVNSEMIDKTDTFIDTIAYYFNKIDTLERDNIRRFKVSFGKNIESLPNLLKEYIGQEIDYEKNMNLIKSIISRLSHNTPEKEKGTIFHNHIPKEWKISDVVVKHISEFIDHNEFLLQYDIFIPFTRKTNIGFNKYRIETKLAKCFQGLNEFLQEYFGKLDLYSLIGKEESFFNEDFSNDFRKFLFLLFVIKIIEYIEDLSDEQSLSSTRANILYRSLEDHDRMEIDESVSVLNNFLFDLVIHFLEESKDPLWLYQMDDISNKISKQSEREKQNLMNNLETKTSDARLVETQKQAYGIGEGGKGGWFKVSASGNLDHIGSEEYQIQVELERNLGQISEEEGLDKDERIEDDEELQRLQEDGYDQEDQDQENEGEDEDEGDYKED